MVAAILAAGFIVVGLPALGYAAVVAKRRQRSRWLAAARAAGLEEIEPARGLWADGILTARAGPHEIRIEEYAHSRYNRGTRVVIDGNSGLTLRAEKDLTAVQRAIGPREIELGDAGFDHEVYVEGGDPPVLRAVLDLETRGLVRRFLDGLLRKTGEEGGMVAATAAVHDGSVVFEVGSMADAALCDRFADLIQGPLELARRLQRPGSVVKRLVENTGCEPHARLRLENLKVLASTFPHHPAARELIERGCDDESQEVQLLCALALGVADAKGRATLTEIATRGWSDDPLAARAIRALGATLDVPATSAILNRTLRTRSLKTARACLLALGENGSPPALDTLAKVLRVEQGELAVDAARALGASGRPAAEGALVKALSAADPDVRRMAVQALSTVGTSLAVLPLKEAAERDGGLRRAVRQSIASIQSRLGASPGQVSLAGSQAGTLALSDPDDAAGRLSIEKRSLD